MLPSTSTSVLSTASRSLTLPVAQLTSAHTRTFTSTRSFFAQPPPSQSHPETEELNEAQRYLANKAARKAERAGNPTGASARHASLYSQLFPALLRVLAYGSSAYFGLHLLWNVLDRDEQTQLMNAQTTGLEATARSIAEKVDKAKQQVTSTASAIASEGEEKGGKKRWYWPF